MFTHPIADYAFAQEANGDVQVTSAHGVDQIGGIAHLQFTDASLTFDAFPAAAEAFRLYNAAFDRQPDVAGGTYWSHRLESGVPLLSVANAFVNSQEFSQHYGMSPSNQAFINDLYQNVLGRAPDAAGSAYWSGQLTHGLTKAAALLAFSESAENQSHVDPLIAHGVLSEVGLFA